jgi:hypothetical protein
MKQRIDLMTIQIELTPEAEARLTAEAQAHGQLLSEYTSKLLQQMFAPATPSGRLTLEELHTMLAELAKGSENLPKLPISAFSRESFYEDRP